MMTGLHRIDYPDSKSSVATSRRYDYSGSDQLLKRQDAIAQLDAERMKALYEGDIAAGLVAGKRIRALRDSLQSIDPVRVEQEALERSVSGTGARLHGTPAASPAADAGDERDVRVNTRAPRSTRSASVTDADSRPVRLPGDTRPQYGLA